MNRSDREPDQAYFDRRCAEENNAAEAAAGGPAERPHREMAMRYAIRAASARDGED